MKYVGKNLNTRKMYHSVKKLPLHAKHIIPASYLPHLFKTIINFLIPILRNHFTGVLSLSSMLLFMYRPSALDINLAE